MKTGHYEAVEITYDEEKVSYRELVDAFFKSIDPTDDGGQFYDRGDSYKTAVFYQDEEQKKIAEEEARQDAEGQPEDSVENTMVNSESTTDQKTEKQESI
jgi:methionine-S-sulfoxide reductase